MSAESDKLTATFAERLENFGDSLQSTSGDVGMLADIQDSLGDLLASDAGSEGEIRKILQDRLARGQLRRETFQLVNSTLEHFLSEKVPTSPTHLTGDVLIEDQNSDPDEDLFTVTTVIADHDNDLVRKETQAQVGSVLRDRFLLQEEVSGGSMGVVYKAMDRRLAEAGSQDHWVAIKVLSPQLAENGLALRALQQEAAKGRCLVHPNIVRFIDLDRDGDLYFLVMEWLEGRTLADILDSGDASEIDRPAALRIVHQIGDALEYAHRCGIIHADIKPGNIMILPNGDAKLFDFGVARVRQQQATPEFDPGVLHAVTPAYSSMQVLTGEEPIASDDVFSLSCLLYRLLAGYRVFGPRDAAEASQEGMAPQRIDLLTDAEWRVLKKGLSYARVMRYATVQEFLDALTESFDLAASVDVPFVVDQLDRFGEDDETAGSSGRRWPMLSLLLVFGIGLAYQQGLLQPLLDRLPVATDSAVEIEVEEPAITTTADESLETVPLEVPEPIVAAQPEETTEFLDEVTASEEIRDDFVGPNPVFADFSRLPPPNVEVRFIEGSISAEANDIVIREGSGEYIVDFVRRSNLGNPLTLRLEEVGFSGNRSPWASGELKISNEGVIVLPAGQERGRVTLTLASDNRREADQLSTLRLRDAEFVQSTLATLNVTLEDDDQRKFEAQLRPNTVSFAAGQHTVVESDPVAQVEVIRYNPDGETLNVDFVVADLSAKNGQDYFPPGRQTISFGPWQRSARLLIPLVHDAIVEDEESFIVELLGVRESAPVGVAPEVIITIIDDERQ